VTSPAEISTWEHERRNFIRCRTLGHAWDDYDSNWTPEFGIPLTVRCERCGGERRDKLDRHGNLIPGGRHYHMPPGYKLSKGEYKPTRSNFRVMLMALRASEGRNKSRSTA
jgi:hypothetical protein